ncbi:MAG: type II toxin-antitoxin system VapC family toxin [Gemmatimonadota bacterium]|nr:type II toxin-antitoxin system VapC family toxin [Gemmatimonadota bacterium]
MRYLLDTNVLSELVKPKPAAKVARWVSGRSTLDLSISCLTIGEILGGIRLLPAGGARRLELEAWVAHDLTDRFHGRIHAIDTDVAEVWGRLVADAKLSGRPLPVIDGLLLATAAVHRLTFVTRNEADCRDRSVPVLNPWT